jgi:hypothetical protein
MKKCDTATNARHTFHILRSDGMRKDGLLRSFIKEVTLCFADTELRLDDDDGTVWTLYGEQSVLDAFARCLDVKCVVSFQSYKDGERIAVARIWKPSKHKATHTSNSSSNKADANTNTGTKHVS